MPLTYQVSGREHGALNKNTFGENGQWNSSKPPKYDVYLPNLSMVNFPSSRDSHRGRTVAIVQKAPLVKSMILVSAVVNGVAFLSQDFQLVTGCSGDSGAENKKDCGRSEGFA